MIGVTGLGVDLIGPIVEITVGTIGAKIAGRDGKIGPREERTTLEGIGTIGPKVISLPEIELNAPIDLMD